MRDYRNIVNEEAACIFTPRKKTVWRRVTALLGVGLLLLSGAVTVLLLADTEEPEHRPLINAQRDEHHVKQVPEEPPAQRTYQLELPPAS